MIQDKHYGSTHTISKEVWEPNGFYLEFKVLFYIAFTIINKYIYMYLYCFLNSFVSLCWKPYVNLTDFITYISPKKNFKYDE